MMPPIYPLPMRYDVAQALREIEGNPGVWNRHRDRLDRYGSPHTAVSDIWVRYNDIERLGDDTAAFFQGPHESIWYPVAEEIPAIKALCLELMRDVRGKELGGVLITKIPPGERVKPHIDTGWHAGYYEKFAIQLMGHKQQAFHFQDYSLSVTAGSSYTFDNSQLHWVTNDSDQVRMTLIVCIKR